LYFAVFFPGTAAAFVFPLLLPGEKYEVEKSARLAALEAARDVFTAEGL